MGVLGVGSGVNVGLANHSQASPTISPPKLLISIIKVEKNVPQSLVTSLSSEKKPVLKMLSVLKRFLPPEDESSLLSSWTKCELFKLMLAYHSCTLVKSFPFMPFITTYVRYLWSSASIERTWAGCISKVLPMLLNTNWNGVLHKLRSSTTSCSSCCSTFIYAEFLARTLARSLLPFGSLNLCLGGDSVDESRSL